MGKLETKVFMWTQNGRRSCHSVNKAWTLEFSINNKILLKLKWRIEPTTSCVRDRDSCTAPPRHRKQRGSLNWSTFMLPWFTWFSEFAEFTEILFHLWKTQLQDILPSVKVVVVVLSTILLYSSISVILFDKLEDAIFISWKDKQRGHALNICIRMHRHGHFTQDEAVWFNLQMNRQ